MNLLYCYDKDKMQPTLLQKNGESENIKKFLCSSAYLIVVTFQIQNKNNSEEQHLV